MKLNAIRLRGLSCLLILLTCSISVINIHAGIVGEWDAEDFDGTVWSGTADATIREGTPVAGVDDTSFPGSELAYVNFGQPDAALGVPNTGNGLVGLSEFSASVVFRTTSNGSAGENDFWRNEGLVGIELPGGGVGDWGVGIAAGGLINGGSALGGGDTGSIGPAVNDGNWHVATMVIDDLDNGTHDRFLYLDGAEVASDLAIAYGGGSSVVSNSEIFFGDNQPSDANASKENFQGDIAHIRLDDVPLSAGEVAAAHADYLGSLASSANIVQFGLEGNGGTGLLATNVNGTVNGTPGSGGVGPGGISLNTGTNELSIDVRWGSGNGFLDLTGNATAMHIHGPTSNPAPAGFANNGGVFVGLGGYTASATNGSFIGTVTLTQAQADEILAERTYINVHTATNGGGEIRGHLVVQTPPVGGTNILLLEEFSKGNGGFTVTNEGGHTSPWVYSLGPGTWSTDGSANGQPDEHTRLTSPVLTSDSGGEYQLSFDHRYDIEGDRWDGGAVFTSINGAAFTQIPNSLFIQNGYNALNLIGAHALLGSDGFGGISPGHAAGTFITSIAGPISLNAGDTLQIQFLMANDQGAVGTSTPNWEIDNVIIEIPTDSDSDGMPDRFEEDNGLDPNDPADAAGDLDSDGATNLEEYDNMTDPNDDDSDDDGLLDGAETNTGIFVGSDDAGTDPLNPDTDRDRISDGDEVAGGSNPLDPNDPPPPAGFGALFLDGVGDIVTFTNDDGSIPTGNEAFTLEAWINPTTIPNGGGNGGQITFWGNQSGNQSNGFRLRGSGGTRHYFWGNDHDEDFGEDILPDTTGWPDPAAGGNPTGWHHLALSYNGAITNWYWNGSPLGNPRTTAAGVNVADTNYRIGSRLNAEFFHGWIDELRIWNVERSAQQIQDNFTSSLSPTEPGLVSYWDFSGGSLADITGNGHDGTPVGDAFSDTSVNAPVVPVDPLQITNVAYDDNLGAVTVEWNSRIGGIYAVDSSTDLLIWNEIDDGITSDGVTTEFTDSFIPQGTTTNYYRVREISLSP